MNTTRITTALASAAIILSATVFSAQDTRIAPVRPPTTWESCDQMHDTYVQRFQGLEGFGLSRMAQPPMLDRAGVLDLCHTRYAIESIELVGLIRRETPVVYVPARHGLSPEPTSFTSRDLTGFEKESIAAFRTGKDMASAESGQAGGLRCVGSLRAKESCLKCHKSNQAGDLLGAFTYLLRAEK
jgi:hypothetical protein